LSELASFLSGLQTCIGVMGLGIMGLGIMDQRITNVRMGAQIGVAIE
jgi:hypothetical protein